MCVFQSKTHKSQTAIQNNCEVNLRFDEQIANLE